MKNKLFYVVFFVIMILAFSSCEKEDDNEPSSGNSTNGKTTAVFNPDVTYGTMTDQDGNVYKTVTIGTQTWMAENLRTTKYNDGTNIPNVIDDNKWGALKTGAYCNYNNTTSTNTIATYGRLYNWYAVNTGKLAPDGWHVPTDADWKELTDYLGGENVAGGKLKETGTTHWNSPNTGATNETGFTALPGGYRSAYLGGTFNYVSDDGYWWSTAHYSASFAGARRINFSVSNFSRDKYFKFMGYTVRCIRD
jgi:uncharacterized protein (TIGR02145 family)